MKGYDDNDDHHIKTRCVKAIHRDKLKAPPSYCYSFKGLLELIQTRPLLQCYHFISPRLLKEIIKCINPHLNHATIDQTTFSRQQPQSNSISARFAATSPMAVYRLIHDQETMNMACKKRLLSHCIDIEFTAQPLFSFQYFKVFIETASSYLPPTTKDSISIDVFLKFMAKTDSSPRQYLDLIVTKMKGTFGSFGSVRTDTFIYSSTYKVCDICPLANRLLQKQVIEICLRQNGIKSKYISSLLDTNSINLVAKEMDSLYKSGQLEMLEWLANNITFDYCPLDQVQYWFSKLPFPTIINTKDDRLEDTTYHSSIDVLLTYFYRLAFIYWLDGKKYLAIQLLHSKFGTVLVEQAKSHSYKTSMLYANTPHFQNVYHQTIARISFILDNPTKSSSSRSRSRLHQIFHSCPTLSFSLSEIE
ncbi:hypothetical protein DFA_10466 [Cavenderia fasciculata]|uniref:Uncharacterized protein n=1 Tax=Cavenderia fasciculata TaxID=261658 RepID=F4QAA5_CACFS|nr:uncharacterized protein DFA_10466 [Cavenderia fasciculata]EGG15624.1 hypothetical protein DFA_10466 [Cavenderia fasciculata]|eukprot:XP_004354366.1 hypothetical protein DFA_10466 [Cavenderia fasciculata]